ncbi:MAG: hypothetical protein EZS28_051364 [Streblomastix strix]|uniref:Uncharacterized protein n=1 Tax=Streblomastix strix TaxID=222440 RepID=A0A5J4T3U3_9EUKA|nr:MAG: hypothetical protein EZS28_051364 [Streblomastix strix]
MTYQEIRNFSAYDYSRNNTIANDVKQRCGNQLGWLVAKVDLVVHDAAGDTQRDAGLYAQVGYDRGLNGRILYPHSQTEARGEYGNQQIGTNITLYTQDNKTYVITVANDGKVILPELSALNDRYVNGRKSNWFLYKKVPPVVSFNSRDCIVHVNSKMFKKSWTIYGTRRYLIFGLRNNEHYVSVDKVSATIPEGQTFGRINWYGQQQIIGQKITFSPTYKGEAEVPSIPIIKLN